MRRIVYAGLQLTIAMTVLVLSAYEDWLWRVSQKCVCTCMCPHARAHTCICKNEWKRSHFLQMEQTFSLISDCIKARRRSWAEGSKGSQLWKKEELQIWHCSCQLCWRSLRQVREFTFPSCFVLCRWNVLYVKALSDMIPDFFLFLGSRKC
jgi:hypothetical protein